MNAQPNSRNDVHLELAVETLLQFSKVRFVARGSSMLPTIYPGDCLTVQSFGATVPRFGDIVLVRRANQFRVHRVVGVRDDQPQKTYILRGDALAQDDPPVSRNEILGRVTSLLRRAVSIQVINADTVAQRVLRSAVRHSAIAAALLLRWNVTQSQRSLRENPLAAISGNPHMDCN